MEYQENPQLKLAFDFIEFTNKNVFLTGKAGTGKTTFLHNLKKRSPKRMIVVAPTGVAAINAGGVTIHSFFQIPLGPRMPNVSGQPNNNVNVQKFNRDKINIIRSLDLLVIDEISMVRADLLDGIDEVLRKFKDRFKPFGGVQLLMIGDLQQLAPIVKDEEWEILKNYYDTYFFFSSRTLHKTLFVSIELKHIFRQSDQVFIDILNKVRDNRVDQNTLNALSKRYIPDFSPDEKEGYITLTTHNAQSKELNDSKLQKLNAKPQTFVASVDGEFSEFSYPTDYNLTLKVGAQVMFVRNDVSRDKLFFNGKIGTVTNFVEEFIYVKCADDYSPIQVERAKWENTKYTINEETKEIVETVIGTYIQFPLKLAWAITIHKSQGLTFEKVIINARSAFAHGQVYVALSRCKTLEGVVLITPISNQGIITDSTVLQFTNDIEKNTPSEAEFNQSKFQYQHLLLAELFDFSYLVRQAEYCLRLLEEHQSTIFGQPNELFINLLASSRTEITIVSLKFGAQIKQLTATQPDVENNLALQERVIKAVGYFSANVDSIFLSALESLKIETDNAAVRKTVNEAINKLRLETTIKSLCLKACQAGFVVKTYLETRAKAAIEKPEVKAKTSQPHEYFDDACKNMDLLEKLRIWRDDKADENNVHYNQIVQQKVMILIANELPKTTAQLKKIKGFGKITLKKFGAEIIAIIENHRKEANLIDSTEESDAIIAPKVDKINSKLLSYNLFLEGKTVEEIAAERSMAVSTIEGHLAHYVSTGELDIHLLMPAEKVLSITNWFVSHQTTGLSEAKAFFGDSVSYSELRYVHNSLKSK